MWLFVFCVGFFFFFLNVRNINFTKLGSIVVPVAQLGSLEASLKGELGVSNTIL